MIATSGSNGSCSSGIGKVVHCMREPNYDVYIGREYHKNGIDLPESKWANHFIIGKDGTREQVIEKYRYYIMNQRPDLMVRPFRVGR